ncbi:urate hydroxylase PuuD [Granulosicoccaceae sp. 1_MG-2023]|nr:urate hydroxylase PuuD [Granulosicoccaceae sp. 1_MG-2023]
MDPYVTEWLNLIVRWIHLIVGIAWIGASFYFNWLEGHLEKKAGLSEGVAGELWAVHGGGFYHVQKYAVAPAQLPETLHWFKWEAYWTWISGITLLCIVYYLSPGVYLIDKSVADIPGWAGILIGLGFIAGGWFAYDRLAKSPLVDKPGLFLLVMLLGMTIVALILTQIFNPRAAYIHVGAMLGTMMAGNVFFGIMPSQRYLVGALSRGEAPDPEVGKRGFQRSLHNNYFTLPVLFIMISNHYPATFGHAANWLILAALAAISIGVRHYFNLRNRGRDMRWILPLAALAMFSLAWVSAPAKVELDSSAEPVSTAQAHGIIVQRCTTCHSASPTDAAFKTAPNGVMFDTEDQIISNAPGIYARAVATESMPLGNLTGMTTEERSLLGQWYQTLGQH